MHGQIVEFGIVDGDAEAGARESRRAASVAEARSPAANVGGVKFDGVDLFLFAPHVDIDATDDELKRLADKVRSRNLVIGSVVAPVWPPTGGGSAMGSEAERAQFVTQVRKACRIGKRLRELGVREDGIVRIDSNASITRRRTLSSSIAVRSPAHRFSAAATGAGRTASVARPIFAQCSI